MTTILAAVAMITAGVVFWKWLPSTGERYSECAQRCYFYIHVNGQQPTPRCENFVCCKVYAQQRCAGASGDGGAR